METLYTLPVYKGIISGKQEIMIGYSDSAKDAGRLAASWAQYETQEKLAELSRKHGVEVTFFHGKGGTVGRGGMSETIGLYLGTLGQATNSSCQKGTLPHSRLYFPMHRRQSTAVSELLNRAK
jgi:hypothetical protein